VGGIGSLAGATVSWRKVRPLWEAAVHADAPGSPAALTASGKTLEADGLVYAHPGRAELVIDRASIRIAPGDRVLVEGASGAGKSTLASLLAGLLPPRAGSLLLGGLDPHTLGLEAWRRRVALAPQFHENHIFVGTLAFNVLLGRAWPPSERDLAEADSLCRELGLGPLLDRMPSGILQVVGETGWQLSHGERSRIFLARALLQDADVVVLDESFAALDSRSLRDALECARAKARALVVIAHP
jgi:ATP-binding cassette subfamily B protein